MISKDMNESAVEFYEKNKDFAWTVEPIPSNLTTNIEKAQWILNTADFGWIELDIDFDLTTWQKEIEPARPYFVAHREDSNKGWNSCCIHGIDTDKTGAWTNYGYTEENTVPYHWTELSHKTPEIKKFWQDKFPSDNYRRIRFMQLEPESAITPHSDMPGRLPGETGVDMLDFGVPVNLAVIHPNDCYMVLEGYGIVPFQQGRAFVVNIRNYHSVINFSDQSRIHVIGHSYGYGSKKQEFAELLVRSYSKMEASRV
jgi:hypothetical protein